MPPSGWGATKFYIDLYQEFKLYSKRLLTMNFQSLDLLLAQAFAGKLLF